jgi:hypothetical protein
LLARNDVELLGYRAVHEARGRQFARRIIYAQLRRSLKVSTMIKNAFALFGVIVAVLWLAGAMGIGSFALVDGDDPVCSSVSVHAP